MILPSIGAQSLLEPPLYQARHILQLSRQVRRIRPSGFLQWNTREARFMLSGADKMKMGFKI